MDPCIEDLENNENVANDCNVIRWKNDDAKDISTSQDMFSDDDQLRDSVLQSPKVVAKNDTFNSSIISIKTPILCSKVTEVTPGRAVVPRTPADLLPFITKTSVLWTSDMETPDGKLNDKTENCDVTINSEIPTNNTTPNRHQGTPNSKDTKPDKMDVVSSPVLGGGKKRAKRKVKRRILNNVALDSDNNNDQQSISSNSDKVPSEASSVNNEPFFYVKPDMKLNIIEENSKPNNEECKENKKLEDATAFDKNSNTSTQDFFSNASFSSIDRLCCNIIPEEKLSSIPESDDKENKDIAVKQEIVEKHVKPKIGNDVLARVAEIKRNQKPLRRSIDISHTIIPKEEFSKSVRELELADTRFSQEKQITPKVQHKPLRLMSFSELTSAESLINTKKEKSPEKENLDVPAEIMDDWNVDIFANTNFGEKGEILQNASTSSTTKPEVGFSCASGKGISINEKNLQKDMRMYKEIEKEISSNNNLLALEKSSLSKQTMYQTKTLINVPDNNEMNLKIKKEPSHSIATCITTEDGFSTASGKNITISEDKILDYAKIYTELEKENLNENSFLELKGKNTISKVKPVTKIDTKVPISSIQKCMEDKKLDTLKLYEELDLNEFLEPKFTSCSEVHINDGFATAGGKGITINEQKERLYSKIYNELEDVDENSLLSVKKDIALKPITVEKPKDKAIIKFNNKTMINNTDARIETSTIYNNLTTKISAVSNTEVSGDGFSTARGKGIKVSEDKEMMYAKIYNELGDADENEFTNIKQNKTLKQAFQKPKDKAMIVFNNKQTISTKPSTVISKNNVVQQNLEASSDGFSTAGGKGIKINTEKEGYYSKVFNELSEDIRDENCFLNLDKKTLPKVADKASVKVTFVPNQKKTAPITLVSKSSMGYNDDAFEDIGDLENLVPVNQTSTSKGVSDNRHFTVPNTSNVIKANHQASTTAQKSPSIKKEKAQANENAFKPVVSESSGKPVSLNKPESSHLSKLKRKLENCEVKRPERCRSFGGFPGSSNEGVSSTKLNKSDPYNDSVNQPLQQGLSVSQHFDLHSDSWLSKVELSYLNTSKPKSPEVTEQTVTKSQETSTALSDWKASAEESDDFSGFSYKECAESFKMFASFEKFLKRHIVRFKEQRKLIIESGRTIIITNKTTTTQTLDIHCDCVVDIKRGMVEPSYVLIDAPEKPVFKLPKKSQAKAKEDEPKEQKKAENKIVEKRKHSDTDSDTPLSTLKKPRTGSELQGRKLFSDDSDVDEEDQAERNVDNLIQTLPLTPPPPLPELTEEELAELAEMRMDAIMQQEKKIRIKKRIEVKPIIGSLLRERLANSNNRKSWTDYVGSSVPTARPIEQIKHNHPDEKVLEVTASNATCYKFLSSNFIDNKRVVSLELEDNARLIFDEDGHAGVSEFADAFLAMPGVDPKLIPTGWIENHYKWIVWKLAAMDRIHFEKTELPKMLTPERVMKELKYRYDREIDRAQRSALRKILEKDDAPTRRMVLCVSSIEDGDSKEKDAKIMLGLLRYNIEVTDGWYSIPLTIDNAMANYVLTGKIKEGTKLMTYGAILLECERGCFPLDKPANTSLKIFTNCTRRARWDVKLGYQKSQGPIPVKLRNIVMGGGMVGEITAVAARVYPLLYREKTPDGQSIYRNARSEEKAAIAYERALEKQVDAMYAQAEKKFDSKKKSDFEDELENSQTESTSQALARGQRSWERKQEELKQRLETEVRQGLPPPRKVTPVQKVRLVDDITTVILTIWGADEDSAYDIKEGNTITVYNCYAMGTRNGELNLTANRITHIKSEPLLKLPYPMRFCTLIPDITAMSFDPKFCEFDTVGVVVSTGPAPHGMKSFEVVNMAYPKPNNAGSSYLSILFWNGVSSFGYQSIFSVGALIACTNLEWRRNTSWNVAVAYCSERTVFTCNPRPQYLNSGLRNLRALIQNPVAYAESCVEEITNELSKKPPSRSNQGTPTSWPDRSHNSSSFISPMDSHTPGHASIQKRLEKLSRYGSSADISPIVLNNSSVKVKRDYRPVTRKKT
ncbi:uncharacterized protein LOC100678620 isoform X1 [Nasonia vitripennis]|uniref:Tower domain-containing protein n=2 Tax=Nasonia vitripennis TaxID=7425 RepID=A0A7M7HBN3_NASVI|nr:uncharacterized protein LOC100678620 isoform X1 [Nasonia vitripennis]